jgi:hypothetical protein
MIKKSKTDKMLRLLYICEVYRIIVGENTDINLAPWE